MLKQEWIDLQVNGYGGVDFNAPGLTVEKVLAHLVSLPNIVALLT